jgi:hypothetical protein
MRSCDASSVEASGLAGSTRSRVEIGGPAMTAAPRSRPTTGKGCSSGRCSFPSRAPSPIATRLGSASRPSAYMRSSGSSGTGPDKRCRRSRAPAFPLVTGVIAAGTPAPSACGAIAEHRSLAIPVLPSAVPQAAGSLGARSICQPACGRSQESRQPQRGRRDRALVSVPRVYDVYIMKCPGGAGTPRGRRRRD